MDRERLSVDQETSGEKTLSGFLEFARESGIRISTAEWLSYLSVIETMGKEDEVLTGDLYDTLKAVGTVTLVKDKADLAAFSEAFDEYFKDIKAARDEKEMARGETEKAIGEKALEMVKEEGEAADKDSDVKEQLGIEEIAPNNLDGDEHEDNETVHGGKQDQHNDVLSKMDKSKDGGGDLGKNTLPGERGEKGESDGEGREGGSGKGSGEGSEQGSGGKGEEKVASTGHAKNTEGETFSENGIGHALGGEQKEWAEVGVAGNMGGKGKYDIVEEVVEAPEAFSDIVHESSVKRRELSEEVRKKDRRERYNVRPNRTEIYEIVKNLRRIIEETSEVSGSRLDIDSTVEHFAKREFKFDYEDERGVKPETVLFIDVGGPVDEWRPLMEELSEGMSRGLLKLEVYLFHNQLYGYCWDPKDGNFARPNGLKNVQDIVKKRKKVIIYGDADVAASEVDHDTYPPAKNEEKIKRYGMKGTDCLEYIKKNSDNVVWINPMFKSNWYYDEYSGRYDTDNSVGKISEIIPMYDLSVGGVQDAIADLMKK